MFKFFFDSDAALLANPAVRSHKPSSPTAIMAVCWALFLGLILLSILFTHVAAIQLPALWLEWGQGIKMWAILGAAAGGLFIGTWICPRLMRLCPISRLSKEVGACAEALELIKDVPQASAVRDAVLVGGTELLMIDLAAMHRLKLDMAEVNEQRAQAVARAAWGREPQAEEAMARHAAAVQKCKRQVLGGTVCCTLFNLSWLLTGWAKGEFVLLVFMLLVFFIASTIALFALAVVLWDRMLTTPAWLDKNIRRQCERLMGIEGPGAALLNAALAERGCIVSGDIKAAKALETPEAVACRELHGIAASASATR